MADVIFWKHNDFRETFYSKAFGVADYKFNIGFLFFEMADIQSWKLYDFRTTVLGGFQGR